MQKNTFRLDFHSLCSSDACYGNAMSAVGRLTRFTNRSPELQELAINVVHLHQVFVKNKVENIHVIFSSYIS